MGYLAGLIDGEGSIGINPKTIRLSIYSTHKPLVEWLLRNCGGHFSVSRYPCNSDCFKNHVHTRLCTYAWAASGERAAIILEFVIDLLIIKRSKAEETVRAWRNRSVPRKTRTIERTCADLHDRGWPVERPYFHGKVRHYRAGCKCPECRSAHAKFARLQRAS